VSFVKSGLIAVAMVCQSAAPVLGAEATIELTIATTHTANVPWVYVIKHHFVPEFNRRLREQTAIEPYRWIEVYGGALSKWRNSLETVAIGLADIGWVGTLWEPAKMPLQNVTYYLPFITDDLGALVRAFNQIHRDLPAARRAWTDQQQVYLGASGVDTYHLLTNFPVRVLADLKGRRILAPGTAAVWLRGTGAVPVNGALTSYYTQIKTGVADGVVSILTGAHPYRIHEVAPYITLVGIGAQITGAISVNIETWHRLPADAQRILRELGSEYSELSAAESGRRYDTALAAMVGDGAIVMTLPPREKQKWIDGLPEYGRAWVERNERKGLPARKMLTMLMDSIRAAGVQPQRDWDRYE
jgi:C4-dicarboxylate-binding protein DctP